MLSVKLIKVESTHQNLRDNEIIGKCTLIPEVGNNFLLFSEAKDDDFKAMGGFRTITTTPILEVSYDSNTKIFEFKTKNSQYKLEVLSDKNPLDYASAKLGM